MKTNIYLLAVAMAAVITAAPLGAADMDARIESSAKETYVFKTYLKDDSVKVSAKNGIVTLTGTVLNESHKDLAQETVQGLPGVKRVENKLETKAERTAERSDAWIVTKVKTSLAFHRNVSASKTEVDVKEGIVTLRGEATSEAQKELTGAYAKDIDGVREVHNGIKVVLAESAPPANPPAPSDKAQNDRTVGEKIDDASITAQVKISLATHRSTSALRTKVETMDGVVTISGQAKNAAEKDLVTKLVADVKGVRKVMNKMTISASTSE